MLLLSSFWNPIYVLFLENGCLTPRQTHTGQNRNEERHQGMTGWEANQSRAGSTDLQKTTHQSTNTSGQSRSERRSNSRTFCRANKRRLANSCTSVSNLAHVMTCLCESTHPPITLYAGLHYNCPPPPWPVSHVGGVPASSSSSG